MISLSVWSVLERLVWAAILTLPVSLVAIGVCRLPNVHPGVKVWGLRLAGLKAVFHLLTGAAVGVSWTVAQGQTDPLDRLHGTTWIPAFLFVSWSAWLLISAARIVRSAREVRTVLRRATEADRRTWSKQAFWVTRRFRVVESDDVGCPSAVGLFRPTIVLPQGEDIPDATELAHEAAHHRHGDLWVQAGFAVLTALLGFVPWIAWLSRESMLWQEVWADDTARAKTGATSSDHARRILNRVALGSPTWSVSMSGQARGVEKRLRALYAARPSLVVAMIAVALVAIALTPWKPVDQRVGVSPASGPVVPVASMMGR